MTSKKNSKTNAPYIIQIQVPTGDPDGVRIITDPNWSGKGFWFSRSDLAQAISEDEEGSLNLPGVYLLVGEDPSEEFGYQIYVGRANDIAARLKQHLSDDRKDFWDNTIVFTSTSGTLNGTTVGYIEAKLIDYASKAKRAFMNQNKPSIPRLSSADLIVADGFLDKLLAIYPVLGVRAFEVPSLTPTSTPTSASTSASTSTPENNCKVEEVEEVEETVNRRYYIDKSFCTAEGEERSANEFVVFAGAVSRVTGTPTLPERDISRRQRMIDSGQFVQDGDKLILQENVIFKNPSNAAAAIIAASSNGRMEWLDENGITLREHQVAAGGTISRRRRTPSN